MSWIDNISELEMLLWLKHIIQKVKLNFKLTVKEASKLNITSLQCGESD